MASKRKAQDKQSALSQSAQQANPEKPATPAKQAEQVVTGTPVKVLAKELGITGKKLRRYLRAQKFQRTGKLWDLPAKTAAEVRDHFKPAKAEEAAPAK